MRNRKYIKRASVVLFSVALFVLNSVQVFADSPDWWG
jgi:hypothetical protein